MNDDAVKQIISEIQKNREELKNAIKASEARLLLTVENLKTTVHALEEENLFLRNRIESLEKNSKENNIIIFGIDREGEISVEPVLQELNNRLETDISCKDINNIFKLGKSKNCPIKIEFLSYCTKKIVLKNVKKLKGSGISIVNDLTKKEQEENKILRRYLLEKREKGVRDCFIRRNKLVVNGSDFTIEELLRNEEEEVLRNPNSAPSTPTQKLIRPPESPEQQPQKISVASILSNELKKKQAKVENTKKLRSNSSTSNK